MKNNHQIYPGCQIITDTASQTLWIKNEKDKEMLFKHNRDKMFIPGLDKSNAHPIAQAICEAAGFSCVIKDEQKKYMIFEVDQ